MFFAIKKYKLSPDLVSACMYNHCVRAQVNTAVSKICIKNFGGANFTWGTEEFVMIKKQ